MSESFILSAGCTLRRLFDLNPSFHPHCYHPSLSLSLPSWNSSIASQLLRSFPLHTASVSDSTKHPTAISHCNKVRGAKFLTRASQALQESACPMPDHVFPLRDGHAGLLAVPQILHACSSVAHPLIYSTLFPRSQGCQPLPLSSGWCGGIAWTRWRAWSAAGDSQGC